MGSSWVSSFIVEGCAIAVVTHWWEIDRFSNLPSGVYGPLGWAGQSQMGKGLYSSCRDAPSFYSFEHSAQSPGFDIMGSCSNVSGDRY
ncbi:hypothetical protein [Leptolyngbya sp. CCY15150]|uniref:hypothetical protein n=1 Tax=Leptolyngbya sp. CCY15150 TaxID=2767772 RepID=UPI00195110CE|nr:hypothetical protein [Leptolyngbya sp. CCY15150]